MQKGAARSCNPLLRSWIVCTVPPDKVKKLRRGAPEQKLGGVALTRLVLSFDLPAVYASIAGSLPRALPCRLGVHSRSHGLSALCLWSALRCALRLAHETHPPHTQMRLDREPSTRHAMPTTTRRIQDRARRGPACLTQQQEAHRITRAPKGLRSRRGANAERALLRAQAKPMERAAGCPPAPGLFGIYRHLVVIHLGRWLLGGGLGARPELRQLLSKHDQLLLPPGL